MVQSVRVPKKYEPEPRPGYETAQKRYINAINSTSQISTTSQPQPLPPSNLSQPLSPSNLPQQNQQIPVSNPVSQNPPQAASNLPSQDPRDRLTKTQQGTRNLFNIP